MNRGVTLSCRNETFCQEEGAEVKGRRGCGRCENGPCRECKTGGMAG